jgi:hypothetical protein
MGNSLVEWVAQLAATMTRSGARERALTNAQLHKDAIAFGGPDVEQAPQGFWSMAHGRGSHPLMQRCDEIHGFCVHIVCRVPSHLLCTRQFYNFTDPLFGLQHPGHPPPCTRSEHGPGRQSTPTWDAAMRVHTKMPASISRPASAWIINRRMSW